MLSSLKSYTYISLYCLSHCSARESQPRLAQAEQQ